MKKVLFLLLMVAAFVACSKDDDTNDQTDQSYIITSIDSVIGLNQTIQLLINSDNLSPHASIIWFDNEVRLNSEPLHTKEFNWTPAKTGDHNIKASVQDGNNTIEYSADFKVVYCDLALGILGDNVEKIARSEGGSPDDLALNRLLYKRSKETIIYSFKNDILYKIEKISHKTKQPTTKPDYMLPVTMFESYYDSYTSKYGNSTHENYTSLNTDENSIVQYGGNIYNGTMRIFAEYETQKIKASVEVHGPSKYSYGFDIDEIIESK